MHKQYKKYKDSGIAWIGEIPEHLKIIRNKYYLKYIKGKIPYEINKEQKGIPYIGATNLDNITSPYENFTEDLEIPLCKKEDILILWDGARAGLLGKNHEGAISSTIVKIEVNKTIISENYFYYYLKGFEKFLFDKVNGTTIPHMNKQFIEDLYFLTFSLSEQKQIADYLDKKCALIDESIEKSKTSIEKLKEYKQAIITEAVTKGLNKSAPLKNSNIEWIGQIPEHWKVNKLKFCTYINPTYKSTLNEKEFVSFAPMECLTNCKLECKEKRLKEVANGYTFFADNDIIMAKVTPCFENGNIAIAKNLINGIGFGSSELYVFRAKTINIIFLLYLLQSHTFRELAISTMYGTGGLKRVSLPFIKNYKFGFPPLSEQEEIAAYLDKKCAEIDTAIQGKEKLIEKLTEYKKSLIFECVTGKRKVAVC